MSTLPHPPDPAHKGRPYLEEADIGSGEKSPGQLETDDMIRQIPPLPPSAPARAPHSAPDAPRHA